MDLPIIPFTSISQEAVPSALYRVKEVYRLEEMEKIFVR